MGELVVCEGATCTCDQGDAPSTLVVTSQEVVEIDGMMVATVADCVTETNVPSFGTCTILTAEAEGVTTPCVPVPAGEWEPGSEVQTIDEMAVLTQASTLTCSIGGEITITEPNNEIEQTE